MKSALLAIAILLSSLAFAQDAPPKTATVPITLDHNRLVVDVWFALPDGNTKRVRAWIDNGNPDLVITEKLAKQLGLELTDDGKPNSKAVKPPKELTLIGGFAIALDAASNPRAVSVDAVGPGMAAVVNIPSTVLRNYDVIVDYEHRELTIGPPGSLKFTGEKFTPFFNADNALIQVPAKVMGAPVNLGLDMGASFSFLSDEMIHKFESDHPDWPTVEGAVGAANIWGWKGEDKLTLIRLPQLQFGPVAMTNVAVADFPQDFMAHYAKRAGIETAGLLGGNALSPYRVGIDYANKAVYLEKVQRRSYPDLDVVGLVLHPEWDETFTIMGIAEVKGKPTVEGVQVGDKLVAVDGARVKGGTTGQAWSLLSGKPGDKRELTLERDGKEVKVTATVQNFLPMQAAKAVPKSKARFKRQK